MKKGSKWHPLPPGESGFRAVYRFYERNARRKGIEFSISMDDFRALVIKNCHYCGAPPSNISRRSHSDRNRFYYTGLDRIDPKQGYKVENVLPCCKRDNYLRNVFFTVEETEVMVRALQAFRMAKSA